MEGSIKEPGVQSGSGRRASHVSHNLQGQRLGAKGRQTRARIMAATLELLAEESEVPISLSAVARQVPLGMTSLYNYFSDLTELLLAVLEPVMASADQTLTAQLREHWGDAELGERSQEFLNSFYDFWSQHTQLLHLRNSMADSGDRRMLLHRVTATQPLIGLLVGQMGLDPENCPSGFIGAASVLITAIERVVTVSTDSTMYNLFGETVRKSADHYMVPSARMLELMLRDLRIKAGTI